MQAVQQDEADGPLILREVPVPEPRAGQVLVRMAASPINPSDLGALGGTSYREERSYPFTPGIEGNGTVVAAGDGLLARFLNGRRVACSALQPGDSAWAQYMVTSASLCTPLQYDVGLEEGAMLLVNPTTMLLKHLRVEGRYLANWMRKKNLLQTLILSRQAQSLISADLQSPVRKRLPLSAAQDGLQAYVSSMSAGKVLFVMEKRG